MLSLWPPSFCQSVSGCDACLGLPTCALWRVVPLSTRCRNGIALLFMSRTRAALGGRQAGVAAVGGVLVWLSGTRVPHWTQRRELGRLQQVVWSPVVVQVGVLTALLVVDQGVAPR